MKANLVVVRSEFNNCVCVVCTTVPRVCCSLAELPFSTQILHHLPHCITCVHGIVSSTCCAILVSGTHVVSTFTYGRAGRVYVKT